LLKTLLRRAYRAGLIFSMALAAGCGTNGSDPAPTASNSSGGSTAVATTPPTPPPPPPTAASVPSPSLAGEVAIADSFDVNQGLEPAAGTGRIAPPSPDDVSGFRFMCKPSHISKDDPVVYPGQPGASHLHMFWGNTGTNASSTYQSLRTTGQSTCDNRGTDTPLNRSAYWMPAMLDGAGHVVLPDMINTYYKQLPHGSPNCSSPPNGTQSVGICVDIPNGLRFVFGYNMATGTGGPNDPNSNEHYSMWFECWSDLIGTPTGSAATGRYSTIADVVAAGCPSGGVLVAQGVIPVCWDGKNLDSPDHRSHLVSYMPDTNNGIRCPADHPYVLPSLQMRAEFTTDDNFVAGKWHFSSDEMVPGIKAGSTFHFDYFEAWSPTIKNAWFRNCIDKHLTCAEGDLGNGLQMKDAGVPAGGWTRHQLLPSP
jgi:hypothetical protein